MVGNPCQNDVFSRVFCLPSHMENINRGKDKTPFYKRFSSWERDIGMFSSGLVFLFALGVICRAESPQTFPQGFLQIGRFQQSPVVPQVQTRTQPQTQASSNPAGRILEPPVPHLCANRKIHETFGGKGYWFSWKDPSNSKEKDWLDGRNFCRQRCMDLVSLETSVENEFVKQKIVEGQQKYIWTSGRLCDFKGCEDREDLKPIAINGWFWSGELRKLAPVTNRLQNDWSPSGGINKPQPDNREFVQGGAPETCLAILNNFYGDGVHWHDVACHHRKPIVCEDSEALLRYVRHSYPGIRV